MGIGIVLEAKGCTGLPQYRDPLGTENVSKVAKRS